MTIHRHLTRGSAALLLVGTGLTTLVTAAVPGPAAAAASCSALELVGARSSADLVAGDDYASDPTRGVGALLASVDATLSGLAGATGVATYGVHYPAVALPDSVSNWIDSSGAARHVVPSADYLASLHAGTTDLMQHLTQQHAACPSERFFVAGYAEGAQVVGDALAAMPAELRATVAGAALFADPTFDPQSSSAVTSSADHAGMLGKRTDWAADLRPRVVSYCERFDPVCGLSWQRRMVSGEMVSGHDLTMLSSHGFSADAAYGTDGTATDAARRLARLAGLATPVASALPVDIAFAVDSTSSMQVSFPKVAADIGQLTHSLAALSADARFALVDYKDDPADDAPYQARTDVAFTPDPDAVTTAVSQLVAGGGNDTAESVYSGAMQAIGLPWRPGARKIVVVIGDALGKDPEPVTGYTAASVKAAALAAGTVTVSTVALIPAVETIDFMSRLALDNGGTALVAPDATTFAATLEAGAITTGAAPQADAGGPYQTVQGLPLALTAGASRDAGEDIAGYDWDLDGDGTYDVTSTQPVVQHTFTAIGTHQVTLRVRSSSGLVGLATAAVEVDPAPLPVSTPVGLVGTAGNRTAALDWQASASGGAPAWYAIHGEGGAVLDRFSARPDVAPGWIDVGLVNGTTYSYGVSAGNASGESPSAGPVSVTPAAPPALPILRTPAAAPRALRVQATNRAIVVSWAPASAFGPSSVRSFTVTWHRHGSAVSRTRTVPASSHSLRLTGLQNDERWDVTVAATTASGSGRPAAGQGVPHLPVGDYNGDGTTDVAAYRSGSGVWSVHGAKPAQVGRNVIPVPGDYNGDGRTDVAVYNPRSGSWTVRGRKPLLVGRDLVPVAGDYDGDGRTDIALYNPRTGSWTLRGHKPVRVGTHLVPVPGDYNGDGRTDIAVYNPRDGVWTIHGLKAQHVGKNLVPVPSDYNGDGRTDIAVYNPRDGVWNVHGLKPQRVGRNLVPVPGDYNGDGRTDVAVYSASTGSWTIHGRRPLQVGRDVQPVAG